MQVIRTFFITLCLSLYSISSAFALTLTDSPPITVTQNGQVIENVHIVSDGGAAIKISGFDDVVIRNVKIEHTNGYGIDCSSAHRLSITNVDITHIGLGSPLPSTSENNINCKNSNNVIISHARLRGGSSGIYILDSNSPNFSFIEGYDFRGPKPRGQLVQFNKSPNCVLEDFSAIHDPDPAISWPEDIVSVYQSAGCVVQRGLVDGNNSTHGVGIMFEQADNGLIEDVHAIRQGNGNFATWADSENVTFRRTHVKDNICVDQGRGESSSNALIWQGGYESTNLRIEDSKYFNLCNDNLIWIKDKFTLVDIREEDFVLRDPIVNVFPWEDGVSADFTSSTSNLTASFTDTSTSNGGTITNWFWEFGDGGVATTANPSHTYSVDGNYTVSLTVADNQGASDSVIQNITLTVSDPNQPPTAGFTSSVQGLTVNFTDTSTDSDGTIASRSWNFGDGGVSTSANPSHTYAAAGTYTVSLTVTDDSGATDSVSQSVILTVSNSNEAPTAGFSSRDFGLMIEFNNFSTDSDGTIVSQSWNFGDGATSTAQNPSHTYSSSGIYTVSLTVTDNDGASDTLSKSVTVIGSDQAPTAGFTYSILDLKVNFIDTSTDSDGTIASWSWSFGDGGQSTSANPSHTYTAGGTYSASLTVIDNDGASSNFSQNVTVIDPNQAPEAPTSLTASSDRIEKGKNRTKKITLSWKDNSDNETEFVIERCGEKGNRNCNFHEWMILPEESVFYQFESTSSYKYRVKARKDQIHSMPSNEVKG